MAKAKTDVDTWAADAERYPRMAKHLRLAKWLVEAVEARGAPQKRTFSVQLAWELEQVPEIAAMKPRKPKR
jgi:hypothetical protein